jgi:WD40 repeat protein
LQLALNWREKQQPTITWAVQYNPAFERAMVFLDTSASEFRKEEENKIRLQRRRLKVTRMFSLVLGGIAVIAMGLFLWTRDLQSQAEARRIEAEEQRVLAEQSAEEAKRQEEAALAARDIADVERERAVMASNLAEERRKEAEAATELAKQRQLQADRSAEEARMAQALAQANADTATIQRIRAEQASEEALKRRMLSVAQSMAVKSEQMRIDTLLKGLLAYQSYSFNKQYEGISYDPDIFKSSYNGIKFFKGHDFNVHGGHSSIVRTMVPHKGNIISGGSDGQVISWDFSNNSSKVLISDLPIVKRMMVAGQSLLCLTSNSIINYQLSNDQFANFNLAGYEMKDMFITNEGKYILVYDDRIVLADDYKNAGEELFTTNIKINAVKYEMAGGYLFAALSDGRIIYWKNLFSAEDSELLLATLPDGNWGEISFNYQKNIVAAGTGNNQGAIYLWNINTGKQINSLRGHNAKITGISFSSDGALMASASYDGSVCLWNMNDLNTLPVRFDEHGTWVTSVGFSPDDAYVISGDKDGNLRTLPTKITSFIDEYCSYLTRDLTELEWQNYVGEDIPYEPTKCTNRQ